MENVFIAVYALMLVTMAVIGIAAFFKNIK